jgi:hypothetical protein
MPAKTPPSTPNPSQTNTYPNVGRPLPPLRNAQGPGSYDGSHLSPDVRRALSDLDPDLAAGIRRVADTK